MKVLYVCLLYPKPYPKWVSVQLQHMTTYAERRGYALELIQEDDADLQQFRKRVDASGPFNQFGSTWHGKTLCKLLALQRFLNSSHEQMLLIDLDIVILDDHDVFGTPYEPGLIGIETHYFAEPCGSWQKDKMGFHRAMAPALGLELPERVKMTAGGLIRADRKAATAVVDEDHEHNIFRSDALFKLILESKTKNVLTDESYLELAVLQGRLKLYNIPAWLICPVYTVLFEGFLEGNRRGKVTRQVASAKMIHFCGESKTLIPVFHSRMRQ